MFDSVDRIVESILFSHGNVSLSTIINPYADGAYSAQMQLAQGLYFGSAIVVFLLLIVYVVLKYLYGFFQLNPYGYPQSRVVTYKTVQAIFALVAVLLGGLTVYSAYMLEFSTDTDSIVFESSLPLESSINVTADLPVYEADREAVIADLESDEIVDVITSMASLQHSIDELREQRNANMSIDTLYDIDEVFHAFNKSVSAVTQELIEDYRLFTENPQEYSSIEIETIDNATIVATFEASNNTSTLRSIAVSFPFILGTFHDQMVLQYEGYNALLAQLSEVIGTCSLPITADSFAHFILGSITFCLGVAAFVNVFWTRPRGLGYFLIFGNIALLVAAGFLVGPSIYYNDVCSSELILCGNPCSSSVQPVEPSMLVNQTGLAMVMDLFRVHGNAVLDSNLGEEEVEGLTKFNDTQMAFANVMDALVPFEEVIFNGYAKVQNDYSEILESANIVDKADACDGTYRDQVCSVAFNSNNVLFFSTLSAIVLLLMAACAFRLDKISKFRNLKV